MSKINVTIDNKAYEVNNGDKILDIARENGIDVPAICYLNKCSPTLACRMCMVEVDGKIVFSCNAKAKEGSNITTINDEISQKREDIMRVYDINHPLKCGTCDKSGECELQNFTTTSNVENQTLSIESTYQEPKKWNKFINYDASLCISCERCIKVCKNVIGDDALQTIPRPNGASIALDFKETTDKDAFAVWTRLNKSIIAPKNGDTLDCSSCGECIPVCPVGAIVSSDFQYTSNAWELKKIPASCSHCSASCYLDYDVKKKQSGTLDNAIYRVSSDFHFKALCGAGRFGFDFENTNGSKDELKLKEAVGEISKASRVSFSSFITNEEAFILQKLKEKLGFSLINDDAYNYQQFLKNYSKTSGRTIYSASEDDVSKSDFIAVVGSFLRSDNPSLGYALNNTLQINKASSLYFHPIFDGVIDATSKTSLSLKTKTNTEEAALYLLLDYFSDDSLPQDVKTYINSLKFNKNIDVEETIYEEVKELVKKTIKEGDEEKEVEQEVVKKVAKKVSKTIEVTTTKLLEIMGLNEEFYYKELVDLSKAKTKHTLIIGEDLYNNSNSEKLANLVGLIDKHTPFNVLIIPSKTNTLGVSLLCDLSPSLNKPCDVGYNAKASYLISSCGKGDFNTPALNQQEGTFLNMDKRVVPINAALNFTGYNLNDIAAYFGIYSENTIDYTKHLPSDKGFKNIEFDDLTNTYALNGDNNRGYEIESSFIDVNEVNLSEITLSQEQDANIYSANPIMQFSVHTNKAHQINDKKALYVSKDLAQNISALDDDNINITFDDLDIATSIKIDDKLDGNIGYLANFDGSFDNLFISNRFIKANIQKV